MKKLYLTLLFAISLFTLCNAQWKPQGLGILPDGYGILDLSVVDESTVWALASDRFNGDIDTIPEIIIKSTNGGVSWEVDTLDAFIDKGILSLSAVGGEIAWLSAIDAQGNGYFYKTINGGDSWQLKHTLPGTMNNPWYPVLKFTDTARGYFLDAFSDHSGNTPDGGVTWNEYPMTSPFISGEYYSPICPQNWMEAKGDTLLYGTNKRIFRSVNGGMSWEVVHSFSGNYEITSVAFDDNGFGLASADFTIPPINFLDYTVLRKSENFGKNWELLPNADLPLSCLTQVPGQTKTFFAISGAYGWWDAQTQLSWASAYTSDGGQTWETIDRDTPYNCIGFASMNAGWVGTVGYFDYGPGKPAVFKWEGIVGSTEKQALQSGISISPNPFTDYLYLSSERYQVEFIECFNAQGQRMVMLNTGELNQYDFSNFPSGIYFMQIHTGEGVVTKKVVKN